eukprot:Nk52_evm8s256 gene=Nk52_evmTU8s256
MAKKDKSDAGAQQSYKNLKKLLKKYEMDRTLGKGAEGTVKLARHKETRERYVIKFFNIADDVDEHLARRFSCHYTHTKLPIPHEVNIIRLLQDDVHSHENIVGLSEVYHKGSEWCIVMEYCSRGDMVRLVETEEPISESFSQKLFKQLIEGVEYMHSRGVCHRDLKLENVLLDACGMVKISDFGTAEVFLGDGEDVYHFKDKTGTFAYMAPEVRDCPADGSYDGVKCDIWSCGIMLVTLLIGHCPWENAIDSDTIYWKHKQGHFVDSYTFGDSLKSFLQGVLDPDPKTRFTIEDIKKHEWFKSRAIYGTHKFCYDHKPQYQSAPNSPPNEKMKNAQRNFHREIRPADLEGKKIFSSSESLYSLASQKSESHGDVNQVPHERAKLGSASTGDVGTSRSSSNRLSQRLSRAVGSLKKKLHLPRPKSEANLADLAAGEGSAISSHSRDHSKDHPRNKKDHVLHNHHLDYLKD